MNALNFRPIGYLPPKVNFEKRADGTLLMSCPYRMKTPPIHVAAPLLDWSERTPDRCWLAERDENDQWRRLSFAQAKESVFAIASAFLSRGYGEGIAMMILSENSIDHALASDGAMLAGMPTVPLATAYSLMSDDFTKLKFAFELIGPKVVFVQNGRRFDAALKALPLADVEIIYVQDRPSVSARRLTPFADLLKTVAGQAAQEAFANLNPDMVARYMFTSGSTGQPKAAIITHRNMGANTVMLRSLLQDSDEEPPVYLSWLPWNHIFGSNTILNTSLAEGATLYLDKGKPVPGGFGETLKNLKEIAPTHYTNVPAAYAMLAPELERDKDLAVRFFSRIKWMRYGGAAMGKELARRMQGIATQTTGERISFQTGYGATETGPTITGVYWATDEVGLLGLPLPGAEIKLAPVADKLEVRVRGISVSPGYFARPDLSQAAFDEEGFYCLADGARLVDPENIEKGLVFDGRVVEDFKLATGTWVNAGALRVQAIDACAGLLTDVLIAGENRDYVTLLGFPDFQACRTFIGAGLSEEDIIRHARVLKRIAEGLHMHNRRHPASSTAIRRALLMSEPARIDAGEITEKGYINQRAALIRRRALVEKVYADPPANDVVVAEFERKHG